ncbi:MAG: DNA mismatch repair endonuclease MutL [Synergistes sp.]|nr:DNA mismatch repair endonuclease MutL [Synergistes sp.]
MIKRLAPDISTRIAAGEVIERPSSVAKELIENSIDAGAKSISIFTEQGGKNSFVIEDDGCGIPFAELPLALERYATSKITDIEDLEKISTLGYRGEALASVAAVSRMEIRSRLHDAASGGLIRCEGGEITLHTETSAKAGTRIQIDDLFYNLPARRKFLKTSSAELRRIVQIVNDYALIHPEITFRLTEENKKILEYTKTDNIDKSILRRFGKQTKIYGTVQENEKLSARLWWNPIPDSRRIVIMLFVNGRRVQDSAVRAAISSAEAASYGEWVIMLNLPPHEVDVNIHPTKEEIRFRKSGDVFKVVYDGAKKLFAQRHSIQQPVFQKQFGEDCENTASVHESGDFPLPLSNSPNAWNYTDKHEWRVASPNHREIQNIFTPAEGYDEESEPREKRYIGQSAGGFLLFDFPQALAVVDPHAAHERILYEEICKTFGKSINSQWLTLPQEIPQAAAAEAELYREELAALGFVINGGYLEAVPAIKGKGHLSPVDMLRSAIRGIETENDPAKRDREVWWRMARLACRDAVKLGRKFTPEEAESLLERLEKCETPYTCPHGRPTVFIIENRKLFEWFER